MFKVIFTLTCMSVALFGTSKSTSIDCEYKHEQWGFIGVVYWCKLENSVSITSTDAAQIDAITGTHEDNNNNDNVEVFHAESKGQIHFFPRGLDKFFKNIKGISIYNCSLKEVHQSDLKPFPHLKNLILSSNDLEILEKNLFDFNENLQVIFLSENKISHIDSTVFDKLNKLVTLWIQSNNCIDMEAFNNPGQVDSIIRTAKAQCINSDYSNLEQKVKNFEIKSKTLKSEEFKEKFENLKNEIKASKYPNFFQYKLESLKAAEALRAQMEATTTQSPTTADGCSALESKIDNLEKQIKQLKEDLSKIIKALNIDD